MPTRNLRDALLTVTTALPAQNTANNSAAIQIGAGMFDKQKIRLEVPATPSLASGQTLTFKVQDSADGSTFADVAQFASLIVTGAPGGVATNREWPMFDGLRKYIRVNQAASTTAADNTAVSTTVAIVS